MVPQPGPPGAGGREEEDVGGDQERVRESQGDGYVRKTMEAQVVALASRSIW